MDYAALKAEIENDPKGRGYQGLSPSEIAALINVPYTTVVQPLPISELIVWMASVNGWAKLESVPVDSIFYSMARAMLTIVGSSTISHLHLNDPRIAGMADTLVSAGVFTAEERNSLFAAATAQVSRADELELGRVWAGDVAEALARV